MTKITPKPEGQKITPNNGNKQKILEANEAPKEDFAPSFWQQKNSSRPIVSIRNKLLLFVMPTLLSSLAVFGTGAYLVIKNNSEEQIKIRTENQALLASKATSDLLTETLKLPKILARDPLTIEAVQQEQQLSEEFASRINNYFVSLTEIGNAKEITLVTVTGKKVASTEENNQVVSGENFDWWEKVTEEKVWISSPYIDRTSANPNDKNIDLVVRVNDLDRSNFIGAIKYTIPSTKLAWVTDYLMRTGIEFSDTQKVQIIDENGSAIVTVGSSGATNEAEIIGGDYVTSIGTELINFSINRSEETTEKRKEEQRENKARELSQKYELDGLEIKQHDLDFNQNEKEKDYVLSASFTKGRRDYYISTIPGKNNWLAIASIERSEIVETGRRATWVFAGIGILVLLAATAITFALAKQLAQPVNKLAQTAEQIALGNLNLRADPTGGTTETKTLAESFNNLVIQLKSLLAQQASETRQSRLLAEISNCPSLNKQEAEVTIDRAIKSAREILGVQRMLMYRFLGEESGYVSQESLIKAYPSIESEKIDFADFGIDKEKLEEYTKGKVIAIDDITAARLEPEQLQMMAKLKVKAALTVPILNQGQLYGLLVAHHCDEIYLWQEKEIIFTKQLAAQLRLLLERVEFLEERQIEAERSEYLKNITIKISGAIEAEDILETAVRESRQVLKSDRVIIYSFDGSSKGTVIAESVKDQWPQILGEEISDPGFIDTYLEDYKKAGVKAISDIHQGSLNEFHVKEIAGYGVKAKLIAPVLMGAQLRGLLIAHQCSSTRNWEKVEIDFLNQVATQVGLALERANLLEQQRDAREYLQERALELLREVDPLSKGDLTIRARVTEDEIGTVAYSYNATIESLQKIVQKVKQASARVAATTDRNQISVAALSTGAISQREQIEAALIEIQAMNSSIHAVAVNAEQAETKVKQASTTVKEGEIAMNRTVKGIMTIQETVSATGDKVKQLGESLQKISEVVNLIGTFAAQTNLLALKTSLEAARAGEEGRGFAVIADEIRALAAQSAQKSGEIEKLVDRIQAETQEVVAAMEAGTSQVISGTQLVDQTRNSLEKISQVSNQINHLVEDIAKVAVQQAQTSQAVTQRIAEVATISNQTSSEAELVSESFQELLAVAQSLQESVGQFKVA